MQSFVKLQAIHQSHNFLFLVLKEENRRLSHAKNTLQNKRRSLDIVHLQKKSCSSAYVQSSNCLFYVMKSCFRSCNFSQKGVAYKFLNCELHYSVKSYLQRLMNLFKFGEKLMSRFF